MAISLIKSQIEWTEKLILEAQGAQTNPMTKKMSSKKTLPWTGSPIELVELLYALKEAKCFKKTTLKKLFAVIGGLLGCEIKISPPCLEKLELVKKAIGQHFWTN